MDALYIAVDDNNNNEGGISGYRTAAEGANGRRAATARVTLNSSPPSDCVVA